MSNESDFKRLFHLSNDLLCIAEIGGYFLQVNPSWTRVLGWSEEELMSQAVVEFMHPDDRARTLAARADLARGVPVNGLENRYRCKDGTYRWLSWQSTIDQGTMRVFGVARDITTRRNHEQERESASKLEATRIIAAGIAHDVNNIVGALLLNIGMVELGGPLLPGQQSWLKRAELSAEQIKTLTDRLQLISSGAKQTRRVMDLRALLTDAMDAGLAGRDMVVGCAIATDLWTANVDEKQMADVVRNLVVNACEASAPGGRVTLSAQNVVIEKAEILPPGAKPGRFLSIQVQDEGCGIADGDLNFVFDAYYSTKPRASQKGMGLGLTICRTVIQNHGGRIMLASTPHRGTTVTFFLPAADVAAGASIPVE